MNKVIKFIFAIVFLVILSVISGFGGALLLFISKKVNIPFLNSINIEQYIPEKSVIIEKTEQIKIDQDLRLQEVYKTTKDYIVYISSTPDLPTYFKENIIGMGVFLTSDGWIFTNLTNLGVKDLKKFDIKTQKYVVITNDSRVFEINQIIQDDYGFVFLKINAEKMSVPALSYYEDLNTGSVVFANNGFAGFDLNYIKNKEGGLFKLLNLTNSNLGFFDLSSRLVGIIDGSGNLLSTNYLKNSLLAILNNNKSIQRPKLDLTYINYNEALGFSEKMDKGFLVKTVDSTKKYGILKNDLITHIQGYAVNGSLEFMLQNYKVGDQLDFKIIRNNQEKNITVTLQ